MKYMLVIQAKEGVCKTPKPSFYQLEAKSKWSAWSQLGGMAVTQVSAVFKNGFKINFQAMTEYTEKLDSLKPGWREEVVKDPTEGWVRT